MTNQEILQIAMRQSAIDLNCRIDELPFSCNLVSYGNNIVASVEQCIV